MRRSVAKLFYAVFSRKSSAAVASRVPSRRRRYACVLLHRAPWCWMRAAVSGVANSSQLSHGGATSSNDARAVIIRNDGVSAGMVANALRLTGVLVPNRLMRLSIISLRPPRKDQSLAGSVRTQTSATHAKTHRAAAPPPLTACLVQRRQTRAASLAATDARRQRPHLATDYRSPPRYRRAAAAPPASHNSQRQRSPKAAEP